MQHPSYPDRAAWPTLARALALAGVLLVPGASPVAAQARAPKIAYDETTQNLGTIPSDKVVSYPWTFRNEGDAPLRILSIRTSCGCTATVLDQETVPPGGSGVLEITFDPAGQHGSVRKNITVISNDPDQPRLRLTLLARVEPTDADRPSPDHPPISGQSLLVGSCGECHASPAAGKRGRELYDAVCAMCHGPEARGGRAPALRVRTYLEGIRDEALYNAIAYGTTNPRMPGFSGVMGGPLDEAQIRSLVAYLRSLAREPVSAKQPGGTPPAAPQEKEDPR